MDSTRPNEPIALGDLVKDQITGFEGVAVGRTEWIFGCTRYGVEAERLEGGKPLDTQWFDEQRLAIIERRNRPAPIQFRQTAESGGLKPDPVR
jgi:hypothetical protein